MTAARKYGRPEGGLKSYEPRYRNSDKQTPLVRRKKERRAFYDISEQKKEKEREKENIRETTTETCDDI